jgi:hypothetical protein
MLWVSGTELTRGMPSLNPEPCGRACLSCIWCTTDRVTWYTWYTDRVRHGIQHGLTHMRPRVVNVQQRPWWSTGVVNMFEPSSEPCVNVIA